MVITETNFNINNCIGKRTSSNTDIYTIRDLRRFLYARKLPLNGAKHELIERIVKYLDGSPFPKECGGGGNCLFHVLACMVSSVGEKKYEYMDMRSSTASVVNEDNIEDMVDMYKVDYINNKQDFRWVPEKLDNKSIKNKIRAMKNIIRTPGFLYEGDMVSLNLLVKSYLFQKYKIGIVIITNTGIVIKIETSYTPKYYGVIYNTSNVHWEIIRAFLDGQEKYLFTEQEMDIIMK